MTLLFLLILYAGSWSKKDSEHQCISVESKRLGTEGGLGGEGGGDKRRFINGIIKSIDTEAAAIIQQLVIQKTPAGDPKLIQVARQLINPPPNEGPITLARGVEETPQSKEIDALLKQKRKGFFVECGAYDGEASSNSLPFEYNREWTGLLIEVNPYYYIQLLGRNRNVWSLNACLSPYDYATQLQFKSNKQGMLGQVMLNDNLTSLPPSTGDKNRNGTYVVPCFPLETILLAINRTRIDYFSLDVEGLELEVLKTIPFDRIDIQVLTVEYGHGRSGRDAYKSFMESKGFRTYKDLRYMVPKSSHYAEDYIFIKQ